MNKVLYMSLLSLFILSCGDYDNGNKDEIKEEWKQPVVEKFYKGSTMNFANYLIGHGAVYTENGTVRHPAESLKEHGGNMVRLNLNVDDFEVTAESLPYVIDHESWHVVYEDIKQYKQLGLDILLTMHCASDNGETIPDSWNARDLSQEELAKVLYDFVFDALDRLASEGLMPEIVAIGNETNSTFVYDEKYGDKYEHGALMLNKGFDAVDAVNAKHGTAAKKLLHLHNPTNLEWAVENYREYDLYDNYDVIGMSWYFASHSMGTWESFAHIGKWCWLRHRKQFMIIETAIPFTDENGDNRGNITNSVPEGYVKSPESQREWFERLAQDVADGGGLGVICWGGEYVGTDAYCYPTFNGSAWDDKAFWTSERGSDRHELHDGIKWMSKDYKPSN